MAVDGVDALHVLRDHMAVGVHAEGADLVAVLLGAIDELGLIDHVGDVLKDQGGQLHAHADVDLVVGHGQAQLLTLVGKPLGPGAAGGCDEILGKVLIAVGGLQEIAALGLTDLRDGGVELEVDVLPQVLINIREDTQVVLGAQVLHAGLEQVQVRFQRPLAQGLGLRGVGGEDLSGGTVGGVDLIHIVDQVHDLFFRDEVGQPAAEGRGEVILAVGESARTAEAAHGVADLAVDAALDLSGHDGAAAVVDVLALIDDQHLHAGVPVDQLVPGKDASLAATQDHGIIGFQHGDSFLCSFQK